VDELGGGEHRLAVALGGLAGGAGVAAVLALVEVDDALEAVVGMEWPRLEDVRGRCLDADAEVDDGVDVDPAIFG
jgi:hypothetical protein